MDSAVEPSLGVRRVRIPRFLADRQRVCVWIVLLVALLLRVWSIDFGLPYLYHPDEPNKIVMAQTMFKTGDLNPHYFKKPTLFIYLNALLYFPYHWIGSSLGWFAGRADIPGPLMLAMGVGRISPVPVLMGRTLTALFGVLGVYLTYEVSRQVFGGKSIPLLSSLFLALSPTHANNSRYITVNVFLTVAVLAVTWASHRVYQRGRRGDYVVAGALCGLSVAFKYPGALAVSTLVIAHFIREGWCGIRSRDLYIALMMVPVAFVALTPFAVLDYPQFLSDTLFEAQHYSTGHAGMEGGALKWYLSYAWGSEGVLSILALVYVAYGVASRRKPLVLLAVFPALYFVFISSFVVRNDRTFLPVVPYLCIFGSAVIVKMWRSIAVRSSQPRRAWLWLLTLMVTLVSIGTASANSFVYASQLQRPDGRELGSAWVEENIAPGAKIAVESYGAFIPPELYEVYGVNAMIDHDTQWYIDEGFDYLVFSDRSFGRLYTDPGKYRDLIGRYESFFNQFTLVKTVPGRTYSVLVYQLDS
jgi:4-amino-4-deoxy-L-arabinose transferase-like glycosyltransferase